MSRKSPPPSVAASSGVLPGSEQASLVKMDLPPSIRIPGDFVVGQGLPGDGLLNTMAPPDDLEDLVRLQVAQEHHDDNTQQRQQYMMRISALGMRLESLPALLQEACAHWRQETKDNALRQWHDWRSQQRPRQDLYQLTVEECWWRNSETGCLATFDAMPDLLLVANDVVDDAAADNNNQRYPQPSGSLPPGTPIRGLEVYVIATSIESNKTYKLLPWEGKRKLFPWNRKTGTAGEILVMKYQRLDKPMTAATASTNNGSASPHPMEGYCVYSIDGYSFLYPGSLETYSEDYMDRWYWKVVCTDGIHVVHPTTDKVAHIPYGATVEVSLRQMDMKDVARLYISACLWNIPGHGIRPHYEQVVGWYREPPERAHAHDVDDDEGPLPAVQPLPLAVPVLCQVVAHSGENMTTGVDPHSHPHYFAPYHSWITVTHRAYADRPYKDDASCPERLRAAGCGWITRRRHHPPPAAAAHEHANSHHSLSSSSLHSTVVRPSSWDSWFDPAAPEMFHYLFQRNFCLKEEKYRQEPKHATGVPLDIVVVPLEGGDEEREARRAVEHQGQESDDDDDQGIDNVAGVDSNEE